MIRNLKSTNAATVRKLNDEMRSLQESHSKEFDALNDKHDNDLRELKRARDKLDQDYKT